MLFHGNPPLKSTRAVQAHIPLACCGRGWYVIYCTSRLRKIATAAADKRWKNGMDFMGLRNASGWFRIVFAGWLISNDWPCFDTHFSLPLPADDYRREREGIPDLGHLNRPAARARY